MALPDPPPRAGWVLVTADGVACVRRRWLSVPVSRLRVWIDRYYRRGQGDYCWLVYHATRKRPGYLVLDYVYGGLDVSQRTLGQARQALDLIAHRRAAIAIFTEVTNPQISARIMVRWGWESIATKSSHHLWIRRFYRSAEIASSDSNLR